MNGFWSKVFADPQGAPDDARIGGFIVLISYPIIQLVSVLKGAPFNPQEFGIGAGAMVGGLGVLFGLRKGN